MTAEVTSKELTHFEPCDFGRCTVACWRRCECPIDRWDGAPTVMWREVWRRVWIPALLARRAIRAARRKKPQQQELFA